MIKVLFRTLGVCFVYLFVIHKKFQWRVASRNRGRDGERFTARRGVVAAGELSDGRVMPWRASRRRPPAAASDGETDGETDDSAAVTSDPIVDDCRAREEDASRERRDRTDEATPAWRNRIARQSSTSAGWDRLSAPAGAMGTNEGMASTSKLVALTAGQHEMESAQTSEEERDSVDESASYGSDLESDSDNDEANYFRIGSSRDERNDGETSNDDVQQQSEHSVTMLHRLGEHTRSGRERSSTVIAARMALGEDSETEESDGSLTEGSVQKVYVEKSFGLFKMNNPIRRFCSRVVETKGFDWLVLGAIGVNTLLLCLSQPDRRDGKGCGMFSSQGSRNDAVEKSEIPFTVLFTLEAIMKMIAFGVIGPRDVKHSGAYLRDSWNLMDFFIVAISIIALLPGGGSSLSTLRIVRILRPLRTISMFPSLRLLIETMLKSLPLLANVVVFVLMFFCIFGIIGVQFFSGKLQNRCYDILPANAPCESYTAQHFVKCIERTSGDAILLRSNKMRVCGTGTRAQNRCHAGQECLPFENPNFGYTSFDTVWWSWLVIFETITLEYWSPVWFFLTDSVSPASVVWFIPVIFFGSFVMLNLALAIITMVYDANVVTELKRVANENKRNASSFIEVGFRRLMRYTSSSTEREPNRLDDIDEVRVSLKSWYEGVKNFVQPKAAKVVDSLYFFIGINGIILLNTLTLTLEYDGMSHTYARTLEIINLVFTAIFMAELALKVCALGVRGYIRDRMNWLDAGVVVVSIVELAMNAGEASSNFTVLRAFRVFRILKLIRSWKSLQATLKTLWKTLVDLSSFLVILCVFVLIFALVGMQLFGGNYCEIDPKPRTHFDTFNQALVTVMQVITHEDWPLVAFDTMYTTSRYALIYFIIVLVLGDFIVVNSLIAILLSNFDNRKELLDEELMEEEANHGKGGKGIFSVFQGLRFTRSDSLRSRESVESENAETVKVYERFAKLAHELLKREKRRSAARAEDLRLRKARELIQGQTSGNAAGSSSGEKRKRSGALNTLPLERFQCASFFGLFPPSHPVRRVCFVITDDKRFDTLILVLIVVSSLFMVWETPANLEKKSFEKTSAIFDYCFTSAFVLEMVMKCIALGFYNEDSGAYVKNPWNVLDGTIVFLGLLGMGLGSSANLKWVRSLRAMRVLRPLRLLGRVQGLKVVINAIIASIPSLVYVLLVCFIVWIIFAITGMSLFMGKFKRCSDDRILTRTECVDAWRNVTAPRMWDVLTSSCNDPSVTVEASCVGLYQSSHLMKRRWESADSNFDSFPRALLTLFETTGGEGWTVTMFNAVDSVDADSAPMRDKNPELVWYFMAFIILSNFFLFNMCIGIVIDNFLKISTSSLTRSIMTDSQARWVAQHRNKRFSVKVSFFQKPPAQKWRKAFLKLVTDWRFDTFILGTIVVNTIVLMTETAGDSGDKAMALKILNLIFTSIFTLEAILKLGAFFPKLYFTSWWNVFDFLVVSTSIVGIAMESGQGGSAFRALRICRIFRMVKKWKSLNTLFQTLVMTIPALGNISLLLALLFFIYAILGVRLFGKLAYGPALNTHTNFKTFENSLGVLLRSLTGEGWQEIMYDCMNQHDCDSSVDCAIGTCCGNSFAPIYFVSFVTFTSFIIVNLLIAVVLDNYSWSQKNSENQEVTPSDVKSFRRVWKKFDPDLTGFINPVDIRGVILSTPPPLGMKGKRISDLGMLNFVRSLHLPDGARYIHYTELLQSVTARAMGVNTEYLPREIRLELEEEREAAKRASLHRVRARVRHRVKKASRQHSDDEDDVLESEFVRELSALSGGPSFSRLQLRDLNGEPVSLAVLLIVLKLQRNFRARRERRLAAKNKNPWSDAIAHRSLSRTSWDERVRRHAQSDAHRTA